MNAYTRFEIPSRWAITHLLISQPYVVATNRAGLLVIIDTGVTPPQMNSIDIGGTGAISIHKDRVAIGNTDGVIRVWCIRTGTLLHTLPGPDGVLTSINLSNASEAISGAVNGEIRIWNIDSGECKAQLSGHNGPITGLASRDNIVVSSSIDGTLKIWNGHTGSCLYTLHGHASAAISTFVLNEDWSKLASSSADGSIELWRQQDGTLTGTISGPSPFSSKLTTLEGELFSLGGDGFVRKWNWETAGLLDSWEVCSEGEAAAGIVHADRYIITGDTEGKLMMWQATDHQFLGEQTRPGGCIWQLVSEDGILAASSRLDEDKQLVEIWKVSDWDEIKAMLLNKT